MKNVATKCGIRAALFSVLSVLLLTGCEDPRRVSWSPEGTTAAVIAGDGLRISDSDGNVGEPLPNIELANWFPDSKKLLLVEYEKVSSWAKVQEFETPDDLKVVMATATTMLNVAKQNKGDWAKFEKEVSNLSHNREAVIYLRENKDKDMTTLGENWSKIKTTVDVGVHKIASYDVSDKVLTGRREIFKTMRDVKEVRLSPQGKAFLLVTRPEKDADYPYTLSHVDVVTGKASTVSSATSMSPDWSKDSREIYFFETEAGTELRDDAELKRLPLLGSLFARSIDPDTESLDNNNNENRRLSRVLFNKNARVRALCDGSVAFSSSPVQLPASDSQILRKQTLYLVKPNQSVMVSPMIPAEEPDTGGDLMEFFEVNPSGKVVLLPSRKDGVSIYRMDTGSAVRIDGGQLRWSKKLSFIPSWKSETEVCLPMTRHKTGEKEDEKTEVVIWSLSEESAKAISSGWPTTARKKFLD